MAQYQGHNVDSLYGWGSPEWSSASLVQQYVAALTVDP